MGAILSLKKEVKKALDDADFVRISRLALENKKVFGILVSLTFDKEDLTCWRAIEATGAAAGLVVREKDAVGVRNAVRRIIWSAREESGGMGWSAPELLAEIVSNAPRAFTDIPPIIISLHEEDEEGVFLGGVLWAISRMAMAGVSEVGGAAALVLKSLDSSDIRIRGLAAAAAGNMGIREAAVTLEKMRGDKSSFRIYQNAALLNTTVGEQASIALKQLGESPA